MILASHSLPKKLDSPSVLEELGRATQFSELDQNAATLRTGPVSRMQTGDTINSEVWSIGLKEKRKKKNYSV